MEFEQFVTAVGYLTLLQIAVVAVFVLILMFLGREGIAVKDQPYNRAYRNMTHV